MRLHSIKNRLASTKGQSAVIFAVSLSLLAICASLAIDVGIALGGKADLSKALDAAALAGAQEFVANKDNTENIVRTYAEKNTSNIKELTVNIDPTKKQIEVHGTKTQESFFARILGVNLFNIKAISAAKIENISALDGAKPLGVVQQTFKYGELYTLKEGGGDGTSGNYGALALGGNGGDKYRKNLQNGYSGTIKVGDLIPTETGNIAGITQTEITNLINNCNHTPRCTYQSYNPNCSRILFLPVVNTLSVNGKSYVTVLGFATFFLEGVTQHGGQADITGRFITYNMNGETSSIINDYGTYGIRLVK